MQRRIGLRRTAAGAVVLATITTLIAGFFTVTSAPPAANAVVDASSFDPGFIISDEKFHDSNAMSSSQIQSFLNSKVASCEPGYTCLKDYRQSTWSRTADSQCTAYVGRTDESAADIIARVAIACGVNPQVLLVLLQKEQTLITSTAPSDYKYRAATGYACPDTAPCDAEYAGFYNQVYKAAWQYRRYEVNKAYFNWFPVGTTSNIQYNPNAGCGTQRVYVQNQATANLYYYTPYVPNAAALSNLYGTGDDCSAYGNRNFWRIFSDWFGAPSSGRNSHGAFDTAAGVLGGIEVSGWSIDPFTDITASSYVWVNVDGTGGPLAANKYLDWFPALYPGAGNNHGFRDIVAAAPGTHEVCVYGTNSVALGCKTVTVPSGVRAAGVVETVEGVVGSINVKGWSLDTESSAPIYVWINVDGSGGPVYANKTSAAALAAYPKLGSQHGFATTISAPVGPHEVCIYGVGSTLLGCRTVTVSDSAIGSFESAEGVWGGIQVSGWSLDRSTSESTWVWVNVDGSGGPVYANNALDWIDGAYGKGANHGFSSLVAATSGRHEVCAYGTHSIPLGCKTVDVPSSGAGSFDTLTAATKSITVSGWAVDRLRSDPVYIWVNIDGVGGPAYADKPLNWIDAYFPGVGPNHGFEAKFNAAPGTHEVCVYGYESASLGCKSITVPG
jgi:hypothetical protein